MVNNATRAVSSKPEDAGVWKQVGGNFNYQQEVIAAGFGPAETAADDPAAIIAVGFCRADSHPTVPDRYKEPDCFIEAEEDEE